MPRLGVGIIPGAGAGNELNAVTRRAFVPKCIVQIYAATPLLAAALSNSQSASGGVSSITVPVQGAPMTTAQATDYSGSFDQPSGLNGLFNAEYNLKCVIVPIQFLGMEGIVQMNAAVIPLLEARMNDAGNQIAAYLSTMMHTNTVEGVDINGFPMIAGTTNTYAGIDRSLGANAYWRALATDRAGAAPTRSRVLTDIVLSAENAGGEYPNLAIMSPRTWLALSQDFIAQENYRVTPGTGFDGDTQGVRGAFNALSVGGVPVYVDNDINDGDALYLNTRYHSFYIHEAAAFTFTGFASTLPALSLGYVGALVVVLENVNVKPSTVSRITNYSFQS